MHIRDAKRHAMADFKASNTVIFKSQPGMAKTAATFDLFKQLKADNPGKKVGMCRAFMATQSSVDATGLPWKGEVEYLGKKYTITDPAMPRWYITTEGLPACVYDKVLMVFEEWGQGEAETKRAYASVMLEGGVPGFYLPPGSPKIALTNIDSADGITKEFDFVIGRRTEKTITASVRVWLDDFADRPYEWDGKMWQVSPLMKVWAENHSEVMFEPKPKVQGPWCNPRSVTALDRYMTVMKDDNNGEYPLNDTGFMESAQGYVGAGGSQSILEFAKFELELPAYTSVVKDPDGTPVPSKADLKLLMAYKMAHQTEPDDLGDVIKYIGRFPKDMSVTYISSLLRRDYKTFYNMPAMDAWVNKNATLVSLIASLA